MNNLDTTSQVTQSEMVQYVTTTIDAWFKPIYSVIQSLKDLTDTINGEQDLLNFKQALEYLEQTKDIIRQAIIESGVNVPVDATFRSYADYIKMIPIPYPTPTLSYIAKGPLAINIGVPAITSDDLGTINLSYTVN